MERNQETQLPAHNSFHSKFQRKDWLPMFRMPSFQSKRLRRYFFAGKLFVARKQIEVFWCHCAILRGRCLPLASGLKSTTKTCSFLNQNCCKCCDSFFWVSNLYIIKQPRSDGLFTRGRLGLSSLLSQKFQHYIHFPAHVAPQTPPYFAAQFHSMFKKTKKHP